MLKQLGLDILISSIKQKIEHNTAFKCYDVMPTDVTEPFYFIEVAEKRSMSTKTMFRDVFNVWIHSIVDPSNASIHVFELVKSLEEALSEEIELPPEYELIMQTNKEFKNIKTEEINQKHPVSSYEFMVCYKIKTKV